MEYHENLYRGLHVGSFVGQTYFTNRVGVPDV
jgi:hypothetical protein